MMFRKPTRASARRPTKKEAENNSEEKEVPATPRSGRGRKPKSEVISLFDHKTTAVNKAGSNKFCNPLENGRPPCLHCSLLFNQYQI